MGVLLLNATYEPLRVLKLKRAVALVLEEKAEVLEASEETVRSANHTMKRPQVIRLKYYVKVPYRGKIPLSKRGVLNRDNHRCAYCSEKATTVDHVIPSSKGGSHSWENLVAACKKCNQAKADKSLADMGWKLDFKPYQPEGRMWFIVGATPSENEAWNDWLNGAWTL